MQAEQLAIQNVRKPGNRMPVGVFKGCKAPCDGLPCEALFNGFILVYVNGIVVVYEVIPEGPAVGKDNGQYKESRKLPTRCKDCASVAAGPVETVFP